VLRIEALTTRYGSITALRDVSLAVDEGEIVGLIGPNGAGKTTLLNTVAGLLTPAGGQVQLSGRDVTGASPDRLLRSGLALVPEHRRLFRDLTVGENLQVGGITVKAEHRARLLEEMVDRFPVLGERWSTAAGYLSGGEAQQLAIARALMSDPQLLLMDEPSLGLAPTLVDVVFELIAGLRDQGRTLLVVEQNASRMLAVADRAYVLRSGEVAAGGPAAELAARDDLFETFIGGPSS
jgi:branched-chain amino acid transport system ATP-binding protein